MATPTRRLTERVAAQLGEGVALAVRVRTCTPGAEHRTKQDASELDTLPAEQLTPYPAGGFPVVPMFRGLQRAVAERFKPDHDDENFVLAFTRSGQRVLLGRNRWRPLQPSGVVRRLPRKPPINVDLALLSEKLIPEMTVGDVCYIVNSVDFGVLTRAAVTGELDERELTDQLSPYYEQAQVFRHYDPSTLRSMIPGQAGRSDSAA